MANDRIAIQWVSFAPGVRLGSSIDTPAAATEGNVKLWRTTVHGDLCVLIEEHGSPDRIVPWHNVGAVTYAPEPIEEAKTKKGPFGRPLKAEEPVA